MSVAKVAIETKISTMIDGAASLSAIRRIVKGVLFDIKTDYMPSVEIIIEAQNLLQEQSGAFKQFSYEGSLIVSVFGQDLVTVTTKIVQVVSYALLNTYVDALVKLFTDVDNRKLQGLTFDNGAVINSFFARENIQYGAGRRNERDNNLYNFAIIPFAIHTSEVDT